MCKKIVNRFVALTVCLGAAAVVCAAPLPAAVSDADFRIADTAKAELGRLLMFDKILSGNKNISCASCHHPLAATGDGLSLSIGEGGRGLGVARDTGGGRHAVRERVPRNAPPLFNLGAHEFEVLFHDGRVSVDPDFPSRCKTPAGHDLPAGLDNVLACQAMFPVTSATEMAGQRKENRVARAAARGHLAGARGVWDLLARRLRLIPGYVRLFKAAFDDVSMADDISFVHAANAIAAFESAAWRADDSPFDRYLRGDPGAMSQNATAGMFLFYAGDRNGRACADCHAGKFQTDHAFHALAMPQIGPGRGDNSHGKRGGFEDFGREQHTGRLEDRLRFRTPSLRNVVITAPYGHAGAFDTLRSVVEHHLAPVRSLQNYDRSQAVLPSRADLDRRDFIVMNDPERLAVIAESNELAGMAYTGEEIERIIDFLVALIDAGSLDLRRDAPDSVPSGLPIGEFAVGERKLPAALLLQTGHKTLLE